MLKKDLVAKSPIVDLMGVESLNAVKLGAVASRAGVGKTQFLAQIAIAEMLQDKKVIHISLSDSIDKINALYKDGYNNLIDSVGYIDAQKAEKLWEELDPCKFGMSYSSDSLLVSMIKDYISTLSTDKLDIPGIIIIDGINFEADQKELLEDLTAISTEFKISLWLSIQSHRDEELTKEGYPVQFASVEGCFGDAIFLNPVDDKIEAVVLKDGNSVGSKNLFEPATMMKG